MTMTTNIYLYIYPVITGMTRNQWTMSAQFECIHESSLEPKSTVFQPPMHIDPRTLHMESRGKAMIGQKVPDFHCEAVIDGLIGSKLASSIRTVFKPIRL